MHLLDRDGQTQSELLDSVGLDHSTVSKSLRRMQDAGLLVREPADHDRRVMVVHLTDKGRAMREPLAAMWRDLEETSAEHLTAQQAESFVHHRLRRRRRDQRRRPAARSTRVTADSRPSPRARHDTDPMESEIP